MKPRGYDRVSINDDDGQKFYGYDDKENGTTVWIGENGITDCITDTPYDEDEDEEW